VELPRNTVQQVAGFLDGFIVTRAAVWTVHILKFDSRGEDSLLLPLALLLVHVANQLLSFVMEISCTRSRQNMKHFFTNVPAERSRGAVAGFALPPSRPRVVGCVGLTVWCTARVILKDDACATDFHHTFFQSVLKRLERVIPSGPHRWFFWALLELGR
jgi:hypothetical protein